MSSASRSTNFVGKMGRADKAANVFALDLEGKVIPNVSMVGVCDFDREDSPVCRRVLFVLVLFSLTIFINASTVSTTKTINEIKLTKCTN